MLASGRNAWRVGDRVRVYRARNGAGRVVEEYEGESLLNDADDVREYDAEYYVKLLRRTFASRLARAFRPIDYETIFADADQLLLFGSATSGITTVLDTREVV